MGSIDLIDSTCKTDAEIGETYINIDNSDDISIRVLAKIINFKDELLVNLEKPDGTIKKLTELSKIKYYHWRHKAEIQEGLNKLYLPYKKIIDRKDEPINKKHDLTFFFTYYG